MSLINRKEIINKYDVLFDKEKSFFKENMSDIAYYEYLRIYDKPRFLKNINDSTDEFINIRFLLLDEMITDKLNGIVNNNLIELELELLEEVKNNLEKQIKSLEVDICNYKKSIVLNKKHIFKNVLLSSLFIGSEIVNLVKNDKNIFSFISNFILTASGYASIKKSIDSGVKIKLINNNVNSFSSFICDLSNQVELCNKEIIRVKNKKIQ